MALSTRCMLSLTALSAKPTTKVCKPSVTFTSTVIVIASTPYTTLPNVFTNMTIRISLSCQVKQLFEADREKLCFQDRQHQFLIAPGNRDLYLIDFNICRCKRADLVFGNNERTVYTDKIIPGK